jgi:uncharacterized membrane protein
MPTALDSALELLLKYRPAVFRQGHLDVDAAPATVLALLGAAAAIALLVVVTYRSARPSQSAGAGQVASARDRAVLAALRVAAVALLVVCLLRPVLVLSAAVPRRNTVAVLVDDSRSMRVPDWDGRPRADFVRAALAPDAPLLRALGDEFAVRVYKFSDLARRVTRVDSLAFAGTRTQLGGALQRVREDLDGVPLAGVVVVTDGADASPTALADAALAMRARHTPVFTVGVGRERAARDVEVSRVEVARTALKGSTVDAEVVLGHAGLAGTKVPLTVEDGGRIVAQREVTLPEDGDATPVRISVPATTPGERRLTFRVPRLPGEEFVDNNERTALVRVSDQREKILYFEGEPRFELKFLRRAVADDPGLRIATLLRSAEGKYLRLDVADSLDLASGFPTTREELFRYKAIILGSVEASAFSPAQLRLLADFVSERGGALLFLGGRRAFAEGGYAGTPLEEVMPVVLEAPARGATASEGAATAGATEIAVQLTPAGAAHTSLQLAADEQASLERWRTLPPLTAVNTVRRAKPGATVLLTGSAANAAGQRVVLAYQRYGRGKAVAFPVQDSWLWQMHASIPVEDQTHETFWRQTLRWLLAGVPDAVTVAASTEKPVPGEALTLRAEVRDSQFVPVNGAEVVAEVTAPSGAVTNVPMEWGVARDGEYRAAFTPAEAGVHEVRVTWKRPGAAAAAAIASEPAHFDAAESREEYFAAGMRAPLLRRIAEETGGRFYTPATVRTLPEDLRYARGGVTVVERKELWDMPITFLLLGVLVAGEWGYRRVRGMA